MRTRTVRLNVVGRCFLMKYSVKMSKCLVTCMQMRKPEKLQSKTDINQVASQIQARKAC